MKVKRWSPILLGATLLAVLGLGSLGTAEQSLPPRSSSQDDGAAELAPEAARVHNLTLQKSARAITILIHASGPLRYRALMLSQPTRLVVDLPESILQARRRRIAIDSVPVVGVRTAQFQVQPPVTRVVVDLLEQVKYEIEPLPRGLKLTLLQPTPPEPVPATAAASEPQTETPVLLASLAPVIPARAATALPPLASVPVENAAALELAAANLDATVPATPSVQQAPAQAPAEQVVTPRPSVRYTGEPISVNLKDVDLKDFFRLIHEISGLNILVDPAVSGTVTLVLDEVPWDQALDIVLKNNNLDKELEGNVLRIATVNTLKKEEEDRRDLARARAEAVDPVTTTRVLSYAKSGDLEPTLRRFLSSRGEIIRDERTNTLIIRDIPSVLPQLDNLIRQLDRKSPQVEIEARVVTASRSFAREIGTQFATSFGTTNTTFGGGLGPSQFEALPPPPLVSGDFDPLNPEPVPQPLVSDLRATAPVFGFLVGHRSPNVALDAVLTAAESRGVGKLLSKPRVITQNNIQAQVQQGVRIPVQTVVNNTITTQFINVVLSLKVTPHITAEGTIFLDIDVENTAINPGIARINGIPALDTQQATTQVLVIDGGTVVIGGVMTTESSHDVNQVPFLGSVPIIGHLFKRTSTQTRSQELLFFITPRVLPS